MSNDSTTTPNGESDRTFVAVGSDDRVIPVVADTPEDCAEKATTEMELDKQAADLSNWEQRHTEPVDEHRHWRWRNGKTRWFDYVSIHSTHPTLKELNDDI